MRRKMTVGSYSLSPSALLALHSVALLRPSLGCPEYRCRRRKTVGDRGKIMNQMSRPAAKWISCTLGDFVSYSTLIIFSVRTTPSAGFSFLIGGTVWCVSSSRRVHYIMNLSDPRWAKLMPLFAAVLCGLFLVYITTGNQPNFSLSLILTVILVACVLWLVLRRRI